MPINVLMPALSPTMTEGNLAKWHKNEGDAIRAGDVIAEIETDKATMEVEAVDEGVLARIVVAEGTEGVKVNEVIAVIAEEGESIEDAAAGAAGAQPEKASPQAAPRQEEPEAPAKSVPRGGNGEVPAAPAQPGGERIFASPLARRMAGQSGLDLAAITGSGPGGRIVKADIEASLEAGKGAAPAKAAATGRASPAERPAAAAPQPAAPVDASLLPPYDEIKPTQMRRVIARRLLEAKQTVPHFYVTVDCEIDRLLEVRKELNARAPDGGYKLSVNDLVIRAAALALKKVPEANAAWINDTIHQYRHADVSVAVAIDNGLITPVIRRADSKGLVEISAEMKDLASRARAGKLKPEEYQGGTFSISNLGMYGVRDFAAIINPPQGAILAIAAGEQRPVVRNGALAIATVMTCTLSVDHRVVDGTVGARYLQALKGLLQDPLTMML